MYWTTTSFVQTTDCEVCPAFFTSVAMLVLSFVLRDGQSGPLNRHLLLTVLQLVSPPNPRYHHPKLELERSA